MDCLECLARDVAGDKKATLGDILKKHPGLLPRPLDKAIEQMWGYASNFEPSNEARHVVEGQHPGVRAPKFRQNRIKCGKLPQSTI